MDLPRVPSGNGRHPIVLVVISANDLAASGEFYSKLFGWKLQSLGPELSSATAPAGPAIALRAGVPAGFPSAVPYVGVPEVAAAMTRATAAGAAVERAPWTIPGVGTLARFTDPGGTIWGVTDAMPPASPAPVPMPFGSNPRLPAGSICSLEMHAPDGGAAGKWFGDRFGWGSAPTMEQYVAFDPGAGIGGVFQSHTPQARSMVYLASDDVHASIAAIEAAGGARMGDPMSMPGFATFGYFTDPSRTAMGLIGP